ncbi:hypothetical protein BDW74DRAFT_177226 [Aspergillus multicolor]|uniref:uncharacterized protein n=1 Tax=Aspergillus multicolor TaxID=41759 RepID=UPI003CCE042A
MSTDIVDFGLPPTGCESFDDLLDMDFTAPLPTPSSMSSIDPLLSNFDWSLPDVGNSSCHLPPSLQVDLGLGLHSHSHPHPHTQYPWPLDMNMTMDMDMDLDMGMLSPSSLPSLSSNSSVTTSSTSASPSPSLNPHINTSTINRIIIRRDTAGSVSAPSAVASGTGSWNWIREFKAEIKIVARAGKVHHDHEEPPAPAPSPASQGQRPHYAVEKRYRSSLNEKYASLTQTLLSDSVARICRSEIPDWAVELEGPGPGVRQSKTATLSATIEAIGILEAACRRERNEVQRLRGVVGEVRERVRGALSGDSGNGVVASG